MLGVTWECVTCSFLPLPHSLASAARLAPWGPQQRLEQPALSWNSLGRAPSLKAQEPVWGRSRFTLGGAGAVAALMRRPRMAGQAGASAGHACPRLRRAESWTTRSTLDLFPGPPRPATPAAHKGHDCNGQVLALPSGSSCASTATRRIRPSLRTMSGREVGVGLTLACLCSLSGQHSWEALGAGGRRGEAGQAGPEHIHGGSSGAGFAQGWPHLRLRLVLGWSWSGSEMSAGGGEVPSQLGTPHFQGCWGPPGWGSDDGHSPVPGTPV